MLRKLLHSLIVLGVLCGGAHTAHAQLSAVPDPLQYLVFPETPGPNERVRIEVEGVGPFLGNSTITWRVNSRMVKAGVGERSLEFTTGGIGSVTVVGVTIAAPQGTYTKEFRFAPSVVHLVWEADTTAPTFFKGASLYGAGSSVKVLATPTIAVGTSYATPSQLSFQWSHNNTLVPEASGKGRNTFTFKGNGIKDSEYVSVEIYLGNTKVGKGEVLVPAAQPLVLFYNKDPLRGVVLDQALPTQVALRGRETTVFAQPYYFSKQSAANGKLLYTWTLGGQEVTGPDSQRGLLTLRQTSSGTGSASVEVAIQNIDPSQYVQAAQNGLSILFGQTGGVINSLFGL